MLSTLEAECIALSQGMKELVAVKELLGELYKRMGLDLKSESKVSYVWEDNIGTQNLVNSKGPLMTPFSKHIGIKYHWFCSKISSKNIIVVERIGIKKQRGELFTKDLTRFEFEKKRRLIMGW